MEEAASAEQVEESKKHAAVSNAYSVGRENKQHAIEMSPADRFIVMEELAHQIRHQRCPRHSSNLPVRCLPLQVVHHEKLRQDVDDTCARGGSSATVFMYCSEQRNLAYTAF